jgi:hypothetical protein
MIGENKAHVRFPYYYLNGARENMIWLVQVGLSAVPDNEVLEMVCVNGCWEYKSGINQ